MSANEKRSEKTNCMSALAQSIAVVITGTMPNARSTAQIGTLALVRMRGNHWQGDIGTIETLGPYFDDGVPRTVTMRFDVAHSGMSGMIIPPNDIEHI